MQENSEILIFDSPSHESTSEKHAPLKETKKTHNPYTKKHDSEIKVESNENEFKLSEYNPKTRNSQNHRSECRQQQFLYRFWKQWRPS